jgi:hypothetical protein
MNWTYLHGVVNRSFSSISLKIVSLESNTCVRILEGLFIFFGFQVCCTSIRKVDMVTTIDLERSREVFDSIIPLLRLESGVALFFVLNNKKTDGINGEGVRPGVVFRRATQI